MKLQKIEISAEARIEIKKMISCNMYDATSNQALLHILNQVHNRCYDYNNSAPLTTSSAPA